LSFFKQGLKARDIIVAGILVVKEAGGIVTDYNGNRDCLFKSTMLVANSLKVHREMPGTINEQR
jgi:fructose-1,6-bisphosphatase/inositol monophosphatase family enzyme